MPVKPLKAPEKRVCKTCGQEFIPEKRNHSRQVSCTIKCWQDHYNEKSDIAGKMREIRKRQKEV